MDDIEHSNMCVNSDWYESVEKDSESTSEHSGKE